MCELGTERSEAVSAAERSALDSDARSFDLSFNRNTIRKVLKSGYLAAADASSAFASASRNSEKLPPNMIFSIFYIDRRCSVSKALRDTRPADSDRAAASGRGTATEK